MSTHIVFDYPLMIREHHLDTFGHVNNAVYLEIMEEARWDLIDKRGYGLEKIKHTGQGPVILEIHLRFMHELRLRHQIVIHTQVVSYTKKIGKLKQWITDADGETCCEAEFTMGLMDTRLRKLIEPTPEWLHAVGVA